MKSLPVRLPNVAVTVSVLSVGPAGEDHDDLREILENGLDCQRGGGDSSLYGNCLWSLKAASIPELALAILYEEDIPIVICDNDYHPGAWKELLDEIAQLRRPPMLIVTSRHADDRLWVEALNLGAYDVLAKPFYPKEVIRTLGMAWQKWQNRTLVRTAAM